MPTYIIEIITKSSYGPFVFPSPAAIKEAIDQGRIQLEAHVQSQQSEMRFTQIFKPV